MRPVVHFISGLPRSGSTLLTGILAQNPRFCLGGTSGLVEILLDMRNRWDRIPEFRAMDPFASKVHQISTMRGAFDAFTECCSSDPHQRVFFDKSRVWPGHMEMLHEMLGKMPKVIMCVRDIREVLASVENLWRQHSALRQLPFETKDYTKFQSVQGRVGCWMQHDGLVGIAYNRVRDALQRGYKECFLFVEYERLCAEPQEEMDRIHDFLGEREHYEYDFHNIQSAAHEDDLAYGIPDLHKIDSQIRKQRDNRWPDILGGWAEDLGELNNLWSQLIFECPKHRGQVSSAVADSLARGVIAPCGSEVNGHAQPAPQRVHCAVASW